MGQAQEEEVFHGTPDLNLLIRPPGFLVQQQIAPSFLAQQIAPDFLAQQMSPTVPQNILQPAPLLNVLGLPEETVPQFNPQAGEYLALPPAKVC